MSLRSLLLLTALITFSGAAAFSQSQPFDINAYQSFLASHQDLSTNQLLVLHPAGEFARTGPASAAASSYADSIRLKFHLTPYEVSLFEKHGFMVTERMAAATFVSAFQQIYHSDLPVFVSTDAILHAWHMSYDEILKSIETGMLIGQLDTLLAALHAEVPSLAARYAGNTSLQQMLKDVDLYLTVPRRLLGSAADPVFVENLVPVAELLSLVEAAQPSNYPLFQSVARKIDFSQFTPRGHYTQTEELKRYFQAMIWLGRTEIYILPPQQAAPGPTEADCQRQTIDAVLIDEAALRCNGHAKLDAIDRVIRFFVGESDNITLSQIHSLMDETRLPDAAALLDTLVFRDFCETLEEKSYAFQRINSQILMSDPYSPEQLKPAGAFLLLGQRFVIDSYVSGNVVYDRILYQGQKVLRMLPSTLDVLYALGNDAAAQLLIPELDQFKYGSNLAALRYLVDSYEPGFWGSSLYNGWLDAIRSLNPPASRISLPSFMQTAAWWQEKINTQLASWAQLRHDNLLYAKQSYTGGVVCSFPETYVEPTPAFYRAMRRLADSAEAAFRSPMLNDGWIAGFFARTGGIYDTLAAVAEKELAGTPIAPAERDFLRRVLYETGQVCGMPPSGWYTDLFYTGQTGFEKRDFVVADVHTAPTDESGAPVGWVLHAGTGPVNMAVVAAPFPDGRMVACVGPVMSYYEHTTTNFKRLTDEEWQTLYANPPSLRPSFVNLYLADAAGQSRGEGQMLITGLNDTPTDQQQPSMITLHQNYPNPFNAGTVIPFTIPDRLSGTVVDLVIYDLQGRRIRTLLHEPVPAGHFFARWDATRDDGVSAATGVYFYRIRSGAQTATGRMALIR